MSDWLKIATGHNWDTYGGVPTTHAAVALCRSIVGVPLGDGGIQIELQDEYGLEATIEISPNGAITSVSTDRTFRP